MPYGTFVNALQGSSTHVYLMYPFVLSWSMLDAMAAGCVVIASSTAPVKEVIRDGENGLLFDFFYAKGTAERVEAALAEPKAYEAVCVQARATIEEQLDLKWVCLPRQIELVNSMRRKADNGAPREPAGAAGRGVQRNHRDSVANIRP